MLMAIGFRAVRNETAGQKIGNGMVRIALVGEQRLNAKLDEPAKEIAAHASGD